MTKSDFTVATLAAYLHITPQQVERLATRGKLPARKVAGEWRFSQAEVHHWMEARMGLLDDGELAHVEGALERAATAAEPEVIEIARLLVPQAIAIPLVARTRNSVINAMAELGASAGLLWDPHAMAEAVRAREELQSTALDIGIALLHPRRPLPNILAEAFLALGRTDQGIPFGGSSTLTDVFFMICSTDDRGHLRTLARLSRLLAKDDFLPALRAAPDAVAVHELIAECEASLESS